MLHDCGKNMVKIWDDAILCSMPPQRNYKWFCGQCDSYLHGGTEVVGTRPLTPMQLWEQENK